MNLVIDANILFAALIKEGITEELILDDRLCLFAPEFIIEEFAKYRNLLKRKTKRIDTEFDNFLDIILRKILIVPFENIKPYVKKADSISPDPKDMVYVALALRLNIPIWSNDKELKIKQNTIKVYSTEQIIKQTIKNK